MTNVDTKALELLGKEISFTFFVNVPEKYKNDFSSTQTVVGTVESVLIKLVGSHEILVGDEFYSLDEISIQ